MKQKEMYLNRLKKFARKIGEREYLFNANEGNIVYESDLSVSKIECFAWALKLLPLTFKSWHSDEDDVPYLVGHENSTSLMSAAMYFGLDMDEVFALFVPGYHESTHRYTTGSELANVMFDFIEAKSKILILKNLN